METPIGSQILLTLLRAAMDWVAVDFAAGM
jgi:hypothetical protein